MAGKHWCRHCKTLLTSEDEWYRHQSLALEEETQKRGRGGISVTVDGDEYWAPSVEQLKENGFKVQIRYYRYRKRVNFFGQMVTGEVKAKGGACYVLLLAPDGNWAEGRSRCSKQDVFSKKAGYVLATCEALSQLPGELYTFDEDFVESLKTVVSEQDEA